MPINWRNLLPLIGKEVPAVVNPAERAILNPAVEREAGVIIPEVINPSARETAEMAASRASKDLPIEDADTLSPLLKDVSNTTKVNWDNYKKGLGIAGLGTAGAYALMPGEQGGVPSEPINPSTSTEQPNQAKPEEIAEPQSEVEKAVAAQIKQLSMPSAEERVTIPPMKTVDFGEGRSIVNLDKLRALHKQMQDAQRMNELGLIGTTMIAGMSGKENQFKPVFEQRAKNIADVPEQYLKQVQFEKEDPNSPQSHGYRSLAQAMGFQIKGNASAADLEKQFPQLANIYNQQQAQAARRDIAHENRLARLAQMQMHQAQLKDTALEKLNLKDEDRIIKLNQQLNSPNMGSARNALGRNQLIINGADKIEALINSQKNPDNLTGRQVYEIAKSLDGMLSMGSPTITGTDKLIPKTLMADLARGGEYAMNRPVGAQMGSFVRQMHDLIKRERGVAKDQVMDFRQKLTSGLPEDFVKRRQKDIDKLLKIHTSSAAGAIDPTQGKQVVKKGYNAKTNQTQFIYADGTKEIVDGKR